jgi:hypothetical protein
MFKHKMYIVNMTSKPNYACLKCGQTLTRYESGKRHNHTLHSNMAIIVEYTDYIAGLVSGKYKPPEDPPKSFRRKNSFQSKFLDVKMNNDHCILPIFNKKSHDSNNNHEQSNSTNTFFNHFIPNNADLIDSIIEKYEQKLLPFLSKEEINKIIYTWIIIPLSTVIDSKEEFYNYIKCVDNLVAYIRILKRGGINDINFLLQSKPTDSIKKLFKA